MNTSKENCRSEERFEIGASEISVVVKGTVEHKYRLWKQLVLGESQESPSTITGKLIEPALCSVAAELLGVDLLDKQVPFYTVREGVTIRATPDAILADGRVLEVKYYQSYSEAYYAMHELQVQVQMHCANVDAGVLFVVSGVNLTLYFIARRTIDSELDEAIEWYERHVISGEEPPPPLLSHGVNQYRYDGALVAPKGIDKIVGKYIELREKRKAIDDTMAMLKEKIVETMHRYGVNEITDSRGVTIVRYSNGKLVI